MSGRNIVSADKHIVRVWEADSGKGITSIQPQSGGINDVLLWPNSGLIMAACDAPRIQVTCKIAVRAAVTSEANEKATVCRELHGVSRDGCLNPTTGSCKE